MLTTILSLMGLLACTQRGHEPYQGPPDASVRSDASSPGLTDVVEAGTADAMVVIDEAGVGLEGGAGQASDGLRAPLVRSTLWKELEPAEDPFDDRPETSTCARSGYMAEILGGEEAFSVETARCNYLTVTQPTQRAVVAGEALKVRLWHFELTAFEPAEAHAAVIVDGLPVLDERVPIPKAGGLLVKKVTAERAIPAGAPVYFHLHNHGANSWSLVEVSAGP